MHDPGRFGCVVPQVTQMTDSNTHAHKRLWSGSPSFLSITTLAMHSHEECGGDESLKGRRSERVP